jgi:prepilin-type N-terminal cleavage/methylation domain-containing protein
MRPARRGFTLIELVSTMVILATLGSVASTVLISATDRYLDAATASQLNTEMSVGLDRIVREIRRIDRDDTATGIAPDIDSMTGTSMDWGGDSSLTLSLDGTELRLAVDGATDRLLVADVSSFALTALDEDDAAITLPVTADACDPIRRIMIELTVTRHGVSVPLRTRVYLRSMLSGAGS